MIKKKYTYEWVSNLLKQKYILKNVGEVIRELKVGVFGRVYLSSDMEMVKWIKSFKVDEKRFFIGAKNKLKKTIL